MKIEYDKSVDAAYIYVKDRVLRGEVKQTITVNHDINLDFDKKNKLIGMEILHASKNISKKLIPQKITA